MHLESVEVAYGARVERGDRIGRVGRTGVKSSPPHLHLELFALDQLLDPLPALRGHVIGTPIEFEP
jgi:murein DD-endopeptidase MepM/ murein hydrolase activator NlpD